MNKKTKIFVAMAAVAVLIAGGAYYYVMHSGARDLTTEETDFAVTTDQINGEFNADIEAANKKYLEKAVVVKGKVTNVEGLQIVLDGNVNCEFKQADPSVKVGDMVTIKGRVVGYDDLMGELKLDHCFKE